MSLILPVRFEPHPGITQPTEKFIMKLQQPKQPKQSMVIGSVVSLALLLAMGTVNAGKPAGNNKGGASIAIFNTCELADTVSDTDNSPIKPVLRVTTTITDKSSGDVSALFNPGYISVTATEKGKGKSKYKQVGTSVRTEGGVDKESLLGVTISDIQLCAGGLSLVDPDSVSLNASVSVEVSNDNKAEYSNRCSDDPVTEDVNEGKVLVSTDVLAAACMLP